MSGPREVEFRHIVGIVNLVTGALVPVDIRIHRDDVDWCIKLWQDTFMLDWRIQQTPAARRALLAQGATAATQLARALGIPNQN